MRQNISGEKNVAETDEREMDKQREVGQRGSFVSWQWAVKILGTAVTKMKMVSKPTLAGITVGKC